MNSGNHIRNEGRRKRTGYYLKAKVNSLCMCLPLKANMDFQQQNLKLDHMKQTNQTNKNTVSFSAQIRAGLMTPSSLEKFTIKNTAIYCVTLVLTYTSFSHINKNSVRKMWTS